jgi:hypothetical protein
LVQKRLLEQPFLSGLAITLHIFAVASDMIAGDRLGALPQRVRA